MTGRIPSALVAVCLLATAATAQRITPESMKKMPRVPARRVSGVPEGVGAVQYDPGAPADGFLIGVIPPYYGNRFDTRNGQPLSPGTITQISWYQGVLGTVGPSAFIVVGPVSAPLSRGATATGVAPFAFNEISVSWPVGGAFFAGLLVRSYYGPPGTFGNLGARSVTTNGQGFHGVIRSLFGAPSSTLPGQNAMVRVAGNIIIPVELLEFRVE